MTAGGGCEFFRRMNNRLAPALIGHGFQQTALIAMLPLIATHLDLSHSTVGMAVAFGMVAATLAIPLVGLTGSASLIRPALFATILCSFGLAALFVQPVAPLVALAALLALRFCQGVAAATLLIHAQVASLSDQNRSRDRLARTQSFGGIGRAASAACVGPLAAVSIVLPVIPAIAGAIWSFTRIAPQTKATRTERQMPALLPPDGQALILPFIVQTSLGIAHVSLAPLLVSQPGYDDLSAATIAGLALAAANIGLLLAHRFLTARLDRIGLRIAAIGGGAALLTIALVPTPTVVIGLSTCVGAAGAMLLTCNLHCAVTRVGERGIGQAAWNATVSTAGLAAGAFAGSAALMAGPGIAIVLAAMTMIVALPFLSLTRTSAP